MKNLFDSQSEEPSGPEGERQARIDPMALMVCRDTSRASANWGCVQLISKPASKGAAPPSDCATAGSF
jgi:hypothetical protein